MYWDYELLRHVLEILGSSVALVAGTAAVHGVYEHFSHKAADPDKHKLGWAIVMFILALNTFMVALLLGKLDDLHRTQRIHADFYTGAEDYAQMRSTIGKAKEGGTIYAVNSFEIPFKGVLPPDPKEAAAAQKNREEYFRAIEEKMGHVNYYRVVQVHDVNAPNIAGLVDKTYMQHFRNMLALQENSRNAIETRLSVAPTHYSMSFVIVENPGGNSYLIWQVDRHLDQGGYKAAGHMIVEDPDEVIINDFKGLYKELTLQARFVVHPEDLGSSVATVVPSPAGHPPN